MISPYESYVAVAEALNRITPGDHVKKSALFNSGAEAVENAVKIARKFTKKQAVVAFDHGYHGRTNLTMALTAKAMPYKSGFGPFASEIYRAPMSYPFRDGLSGPDAAKKAISIIEKQVGADNLAADHHRADPGRGRLHRARRRIPSGARRLVPRERRRLHRRRDPDRLRPHRRDVRQRSLRHRPRPHHDRQGHRGGPAAWRP